MVKFRLLQARLSNDPVKAEERSAFATQLQVPLDCIATWDLLGGDTSFVSVTDGVDAVLIGGSGAFSVLSKEPWLPAYFDCLRDLAKNGFPTFGSCFGFQGLVLALGGEVITDESAAEVGTFDLSPNDDAKKDILFGTLPETFLGQQGHKDRAFRLPDGIRNFVSSSRCPNQAIRYKNTYIFATQFHPELTGEMNRLRFQRYYDMYENAFGSKGAKSMLDTFEDSPEANELLLRFRNIVADRKSRLVTT